MAVLPRRSRIDEHGGRTVEGAPVADRVSGELGTVVRPQIARHTPFGDEPVEQVRHVVSGDRARNFDSEALAGELVNDVEQFQGSSVSRLVELEVEGPHHVGSDRHHGANLGADAAQRLLALGDRGPSSLRAARVAGHASC